MDSVLINGEKIDMEREYTLATREFIYGGYDGYSSLPNCINIDKTTDITTLFDICLKYFEIVKSLKIDYTCLSNEDYFEPGIFGFDSSNKSIKDYLKKTVIFEKEIPEVKICSPSNIRIID